MRRAGSITAVVVALAAMAACRDDGRELREPEFPLPPPTTTTVPPGEVLPTAPPPLAIVAPWQDGATVPLRHTCDDADVSPALTWTNVPAGTVELAITVTDLDADGFSHWVVTGIDPTVGGIAEGEPPAGAVERVNDFGRPGWGGPCPPEGDPEHFYLFTVHALNQPLQVADDASAAEVVESLNRLAVAQASISGTYARQG